MSRLPHAAAIFVLATSLAAPAALAQSGPGPGPKDDHPAHATEHKSAPQHRAPVQVHRNVTVNRHVTVNRNVTTVQHGPAGRPGPRWARGARFGGERRVFTDYDRYHVRRPPPGYEWVQDDNELVLIAIGTGIITDTFLINLN